jgi:hypothetical protein
MWRKARLTAGFLLIGALLGGCASIVPQAYTLRDHPPADLPPKAELREVPFHDQDDYQCGPAALAMALNAAGVFVTPEELVDQVYLPGRKGSLQIEMLVAARRHGLVAYELAPRLEDVLREVAAGTPVVVLENYGFRIWPKWHYAVVVGYDLAKGEIVRRSGTFPRQTMPFPVFEYVWKSDGYWAMVAVPPDRVPATATEERYAGAVVALEKSGQPAVARTAYEAMLKRWPTSLAGLIGLGNTAYALKDSAAAEAAFQRAVEAHPDSVAALNNLANVLSERGQIARARATAQRAVDLGGPLQAAARATLEEIRRKGDAAVP